MPGSHPVTVPSVYIRPGARSLEKNQKGFELRRWKISRVAVLELDAHCGNVSIINEKIQQVTIREDDGNVGASPCQIVSLRRFSGCIEFFSRVPDPRFIAVLSLWTLFGWLPAVGAVPRPSTEGARVWRSGQVQEWLLAPLREGSVTDPSPQDIGIVPKGGAGRGQARPARILYPARGPRSVDRQAFFDGHLAVEFMEGVDAASLFLSHGILTWRRLGLVGRAYVLDGGDPDSAVRLARALGVLPGVLQCEPLLARQRARKAVPNDPLFARQWHLRNSGQLGGVPGVDLNCEPAWDRARGVGVVVGIVDDGLQLTHPDLAPNVSDVPGWDWNDGDGDPSPGDLDLDIHGTQVAGLAAARGDNGIGITGTAPNAGLVGLRLIAAPSTDVTEAEAMLYRNDRIAIKNCSWGAPDGTGLLEGVGPLASAALAQAAEQGRGGLGTLMVFAAGNGRGVGDNANYDGYANSPYTVAVGAVTHRGTQTSYGEPGACLVVSAPSGSAGLPRLTTTDLVGVDGVDSGDYTTNFTGTSASAPLVAGVLALMLEANPALGWRDAQEILMRSAVRNDPGDGDWITNTAGLHFNHKYGAGLTDAAAAVRLSSSWTPLGPREQVSIQWSDPGLSLPDNQEAGVVVSLSVAARRFRVEHALLQTRLSHDDWGDLEILLQSPGGTVSRLAEPHSPVFDAKVDWTFLSVRHWGEQAQGDWRVRISDRRFLNRGQLNSLKLELFGSVVPPSSPTLAARWIAGGFELTIRGEPGETYLIQRSMGLDSWETLATLKAPATEFTHLDTAPPQARSFYRVVLP